MLTPEQKKPLIEREDLRETLVNLAYIKVKKVPKLKGRIVKFDAGVQVVETDSKEEGKRFIHLAGIMAVPGAKVGDWIELEYKVHKNMNMMCWMGRRVG